MTPSKLYHRNHNSCKSILATIAKGLASTSGSNSLVIRFRTFDELSVVDMANSSFLLSDEMPNVFATPSSLAVKFNSVALNSSVVAATTWGELKIYLPAYIPTSFQRRSNCWYNSIASSTVTVSTPAIESSIDVDFKTVFVESGNSSWCPLAFSWAPNCDFKRAEFVPNTPE